VRSASVSVTVTVAGAGPVAVTTPATVTVTLTDADLTLASALGESRGGPARSRARPALFDAAPSPRAPRVTRTPGSHVTVLRD